MLLVMVFYEAIESKLSHKTKEKDKLFHIKYTL